MEEANEVFETSISGGLRLIKNILTYTLSRPNKWVAEVVLAEDFGLTEFKQLQNVVMDAYENGMSNSYMQGPKFTAHLKNLKEYWIVYDGTCTPNRQVAIRFNPSENVENAVGNAIVYLCSGTGKPSRYLEGLKIGVTVMPTCYCPVEKMFKS